MIAALKGLLSTALGDSINYVNAGLEAKERGIPVIHRSQALAYLTGKKRVIAVAGAVQRSVMGNLGLLSRQHEPGAARHPGDPTLGWQALTSMPVAVHALPGTHLSMLKAPAVAQVALLLLFYGFGVLRFPVILNFMFDGLLVALLLLACAGVIWWRRRQRLIEEEA